MSGVAPADAALPCDVHRPMRCALTTHGVGMLGAGVEASAGAFEPAVEGHRRHWRRVGARVRTVDAVPRRGEPSAPERHSGAARHASGAIGMRAEVAGGAAAEPRGAARERGDTRLVTLD